MWCLKSSLRALLQVIIYLSLRKTSLSDKRTPYVLNEKLCEHIDIKPCDSVGVRVTSFKDYVFKNQSYSRTEGFVMNI